MHGREGLFSYPKDWGWLKSHRRPFCSLWSSGFQGCKTDPCLPHWSTMFWNHITGLVFHRAQRVTQHWDSGMGGDTRLGPIIKSLWVLKLLYEMEKKNSEGLNPGLIPDYYSFIQSPWSDCNLFQKQKCRLSKVYSLSTKDRCTRCESDEPFRAWILSWILACFCWYLYKYTLLYINFIKFTIQKLFVFFKSSI